MTESRTVYIQDFLTDAQIEKCVLIYKEELEKNDARDFHQRVLGEILKPNMKEIYQKLGQESSPAYLAYAIEYVLCQIIQE